MKDAITGIDCGQVFKANANELLISTYSGRVIGVKEHEEEEYKKEIKKKKENPKELEMKIKVLRGEIDKLKKNIDEVGSIENSESGLVNF